MPIRTEAVSANDLWQWSHPKLNSRLYISLITMLFITALIVFALTKTFKGEELIKVMIIISSSMCGIVIFVSFFLWFIMKLSFAHWKGNIVSVSDMNYPKIYNITKDLQNKLLVKKPVHVFVYERGEFNAGMAFLFRRRAIFLNSDTLQKGVSDEEIVWIVGRFVGYMRIRQEGGLLGRFIRLLHYVPFINFLTLPYERAMVYTGDRLGLSMICGDISSATSAMQKLLVGRDLGYSLNPEGLIAQFREIYGSFFGFIIRITSIWPPALARYIDMIAFTKANFAEQFLRYEATTPNLPADLIDLTNWPPDSKAPFQRRASGRPPQMIMVVSIFVALFLAMIGGFEFLGSKPEEAANEPQAIIGADGKLVPPPGCQWASTDEDDLRVICP